MNLAGMNTAFDIISMADAIANYRIDTLLYESSEMLKDTTATDDYFYLHKGDLILDAPFILDTDLLEKGVLGFIIDGHLQVNGSIINEEGDYGPILFVRGNVQCRSLLIGGSPVYISGNVTAEEVIMLHYNHGWMKCSGIFTAPVMIAEDYHFIPEHKHISAFYYNDNDPESPAENECFEDDEEDDHISLRLQTLLDNKQTRTFEELRDDLAAGEYVLRPVERDAVYWQKKVSKNFRNLKRVPLTLRTRELCMQALSKSVFSLADFPAVLITPELAEQAVNISGIALRFLPEALITKEICYLGVTKGAIIDLDIPERFYEEELLQLLIRHSDSQMERIPVAYITEDLLVTYVKQGRGAWLDKYCNAAGVSKERVLQRVIDDGVQYLENIFGWHLSANTYAYAKARYDNETHREDWIATTQKYAQKLERL
ncbi:polymer-forming cytoskeletal protein [Chitinophaga pinensis]|uniref:Uncharacterized protein n=1 Tax=Chitinophaga pinensis (strain ATCC 43595 / DSM 2588 / LMG 13176 / NBRC 15968 / NCIMB 11800 / UQM 2034) TaxID=485918 RepID=A0A979GYC1_CHIPD|nr:polymer-forming cytoskeletal protein [Chitinophaga pinensis]ACU61850.1 hypothetical protein Cpin_4404 [Chitinophaga pinensis DSM 2588]